MRAGIWLVVALGGAAYLACSEADVIVAEPSDTGGFGGDPSTASIVSTTVGPTTTSGPSTTSSTGGGDPDCFQKCKNDHANGVIPYLDLVGCIYCGACYELCEAELPEGHPNDPICNVGMETGCSAGFGSCSECVNDPAGYTCWSGYDQGSSEVDPNAPCNAKYEGCFLDSQDCIDLVQCYADCG
jgi:hypothetical protein